MLLAVPAYDCIVYRKAPAMPKVLLVDDEPNVLSAYRRHLGRRFDIATAAGGAEALEYLDRTDGVGVIISDMRMPTMDGVQLLGAVARRWPDIVRIMLTGNADQQTAIKAVNEGAVFRFLTKPSSPDVVAGTIDEALKRFAAIVAEREQLARADATANDLVREREMAKLQREFISLVSHEFRTPLAIISSAIDILDNPGLLTEAQYAKRIDQIRGSVKRMLDLMDGTLNFAKLDSQEVELCIDATSLHTLLTEVVERQRIATPTHRIELDVSGLPDWVECDGRLIEQVLSNLLSNAVKYSPKADQVRIGGRALNGCAIIEVQDFGVGVPAEEIPRLFDRFYRATTATGIPGTGIGLYLVKRIIDLHKGEVLVSSQPGKGSTFRLVLPLRHPL